MIELIRSYCLEKPDSSESFPFDEDTLVFKTNNKMFALISLEPPHRINLKCNPEYSVELRENYEGIKPGYHMNKIHWNSVYIDSVPISLIKELIDHSFQLVNSKKKSKKS